MVEVRTYKLPPTALIPNSPKPLLHYPGFFSEAECGAGEAYDLITNHGWQVQWISRYGSSQPSHYHSQAHECMIVLSGTATIRFGVADTTTDLDENTHGIGWEKGGIELQATKGDVFVLPADTAHKTFDTAPAAPFKQLAPGDAHHIPGLDKRKALADVELSGFTMIGAYPEGSTWDFAVGGENTDDYKSVWEIPPPKNDPVLGQATQGLCGLW